MSTDTQTQTEIEFTDDRVACLICGHKSHVLIGHLDTEHGMTVDEYLTANPGAATLSQTALKTLKGAVKTEVERVSAQKDTELTIKMMDLEVKVDAGVDPMSCLPCPPNYVFPTKGRAHEAVRRALLALTRGRNLFLWGMPGTGKDALVHAFSAMARRPVMMVTFRPGTDLAPWFYQRSISQDGTGWEYGALWEALVNGIEGRDGVRRAPVVLLSDVDRADQAQQEWFRILTDSISGRILDPEGKMVPIMKGTQFVCTANSCGTGDTRGRMTSSMSMDGSILDRLGRAVEADYLDWDDEVRALIAKYPKLAEMVPQIFRKKNGNPGELGEATAALRDEIRKGDLMAEFTHRGICRVLDEAEDLIWANGGDAPKQLLARSFKAWMDGMDEGNREVALKAIDPHVSGGSL